jgi:hypothetical protein
MKKADNFDASKWLVENKITTQSRLNEKIIYLDGDELEEIVYPIIVNYHKQNRIDPVQSIEITSTGAFHDEEKSIEAVLRVTTTTGELIRYVVSLDKDLNLSDLKISRGDANTNQPLKKQKTGSSKPITLTPLQKKEFLSSIRDLKRSEDLETALDEAGNILARILTDDEAEFIEDVEDFGYDADEVEQYAIDLAGGSKIK